MITFKCKTAWQKLCYLSPYLATNQQESSGLGEKKACIRPGGMTHFVKRTRQIANTFTSVQLHDNLPVSGSWSEEAALEPSCTTVEDFGACLGNTSNFCPTDVPCQCKDEKPFCRCDYFRVGWQEYWYMGPKCNHLWNTLGFILVSILPALALVIIVIVICYYVYRCKSKKAGKQANSSYSGAQHNPAFAAERAGSLGHLYQPSTMDAWAGQIPKVVLKRQDFDDDPTPSRMHPQPLRRPDAAKEHFSNQQPQYEKFSYPSNNLTSADHAEGRQHWKY
ncbi:uncharacterized protein [Phaenicophaeus curvirostris]|uniref:uncharacterized protein isoform X2 n=1 Tax=Phaenicophaeus curvirostris TaxID=33595 RepID=UPI0037F0AF42